MAQISSDRFRRPEQIKDPPQIRPWQDRTGHFSYYIIGKSIQSSGNTAGTDADLRKVQPSCVRRSSELPRAKMKPWIWSQRSFRSSTARQVVSTSKNIGKTGEFMLHILWMIIKFISDPSGNRAGAASACTACCFCSVRSAIRAGRQEGSRLRLKKLKATGAEAKNQLAFWRRVSFRMQIYSRDNPDRSSICSAFLYLNPAGVSFAIAKSRARPEEISSAGCIGKKETLDASGARKDRRTSLQILT